MNSRKAAQENAPPARTRSSQRPSVAPGGKASPATPQPYNAPQRRSPAPDEFSGSSCLIFAAAASSCGRADSIALDPHKLLFAPLEAGCLIVRNREKLRDTFHFTSSYLSAEEDPLLMNFQSRGFKAFKIWWL